MRRSVLLLCLIIFYVPTQSLAAAELNLRGSWESSDVKNRWRMCVSWAQSSGRWEGHLTENGYLSGVVGFAAGELVWTAMPNSNSSQMQENQKYRWGSNGVSTGYQWQDGVVYLAQSSNQRLVTSNSTFVKLGASESGGSCNGGDGDADSSNYSNRY